MTQCLCSLSATWRCAGVRCWVWLIMRSLYRVTDNRARQNICSNYNTHNMRGRGRKVYILLTVHIPANFHSNASHIHESQDSEDEMAQREVIMKTVSREELQQQLDVLLRQVSQGKTHLTVEENGEPIALIISASEYQREREETAFVAYGKTFENESPQEIERQAVRAIRESRESRRQQSQPTPDP